MKRLLSALMCFVLFVGAALPTMARKRTRRYYSSSACSCQPRYRRRAYSGRYTRPRRVYYAYRDRRSFWQRHRDALTLAIGTGGGAGVGALLGGKRGAGIGTLVGFGSSALYTYKLRDRRRRY